MKQRDIRRLHADGFITEEQCQRIEGHYHLNDGSNRFLLLISLMGGTLVGTGIILLIGANWDSIPDWVKLAVGLVLMAGMHTAGWLCRGGEGTGRYPQVGEALHFGGALLFLANIALVGQIYNLHSRGPDAWLLWWVGIAALPWILRSRALHLLNLMAFATWFACECWDREGWFRIGNEPAPLALMVLLGLAVHGYGLILRSTRWSAFSMDAERLGLAGFSFALFPFTFSEFHPHFSRDALDGAQAVYLVAAGVAGALLVAGTRRDLRFPLAWRRAWLALLTAPMVLLGVLLVMGVGPASSGPTTEAAVFAWVAKLILAAIAFAQMRLGVHSGSEGMVNSGILTIAAVVISTYIALISSMAQTGLVFIGSGVLLIGFSVYLERNRRRLIQSIRLQPA